MSVFSDPIRESQMYIRRAAHLLHDRGVLSVGRNHKAPRYGGEARDKFYENGKRQLARLEREIEALTGCTLEGRRALDYGCGVGRLALPLAERCEHVYGLDISLRALDGAGKRAKRLNLNNVEWMHADRLAELSGRYDMVESMLVFQHIPSREGERIFQTLVQGLRPGGVGAIQLTLRPSRPLAGFVNSSSKPKPSGSRLVKIARKLDLSYPYMLMHSYSLNRICALLADAGAPQVNVRWHPRAGKYDVVTIIFHKTGENDKTDGNGTASAQMNGSPQEQAPGGEDAEPPQDGA
jgi:2-polyprenyl-3-methyl-5-hydroxy-6-metoxy-1,4-benzoquinol methylase